MAIGVAALCLSNMTCSAEEEAPTHGYVCVDLSKEITADDSVFTNTTTVRVRLHYTECLRDFYLSQHPEYALTGELGERLFEETKSLLCNTEEEGRSMPLDCEVASYEQVLLDTEDNARYYLSIDFKVKSPGPGAVTGKRLHFGPLPLEEALDPDPALEEETPLIFCEPGTTPSVTIQANADIQGLDSSGTPIWQIEKFSNTPNKSRTTEGGCIDASIGPG